MNRKSEKRTAFPAGAGRAFGDYRRLPAAPGRRGGGKRALTALLCCAVFLGGCGSSMAPKEANDHAAELLAEEKYAAAAAAYAKNIEKGYFTAEAYRGLGLTQMAEGQYADACISLERSLLSVERQPADFVRDVRLYLAWCRWMHGERGRAIDLYSEMLLENPEPEVYFLRGRLYMEGGQEEEAARDFSRAAETTEDIRVFINIYRVYADYDKNADGSLYLEKALTFAGDAPENALDRALVKYYLQNYAEARKEVFSALEADPQNAEARFLLGRIYLATGDTPNARATYREHIGNAQTAERAYAGLLACDLMEENTEEAQKDLTAAMELPGAAQNRDLRYYEILVCEYRHDWENARRKAAAFVADFPTDADGLRENAFLASR